MRARRRLVVHGAVVAGLLLAAPFVPRGPEPEAASRTGPPAPAPVTVLDGPARGSLAGDRAFLEAVRRLPWSDDEPTGNLGIRSVVFAGDVPGARWALVVGRVLGPPDAPGSPADGPAGRSGLVAVWFGGPPGAAPEGLTRLTPPARAPDDAPLGLLDQRTGTLVVVAAPGDVVEVSERPEIAEDSSIYRPFRTVKTTDGVAVARLRPSDVPVTTAAVYRVVRDGRTVARSAPTTIGNRFGAPTPVAVEHPRGRPSDAAAEAVRWTAERVLAPLGLARHEIRLTALWAGNVPGPGPESGTVAVVAATLPNRAAVVDGEWLLPVASASGDYLQVGDCGLGILPAGPPVEQRVHVLSCEVVDPTHGDAVVQTVLLVVAPPQVALVRIYDGDSRFLVELPTVDGVVVTPMPPGTATVEAVTAGGVSLGRTRLLGRGVDFEG